MPRRLPKRVEVILAETKSRLTELYSDRLKELILFGSYARGDFRKGSDIDLLLLLDTITTPLEERDHYFPALCELSLKYDTVLSVVPMDTQTYETRHTPLIMNIHREGRHV